MTTDSNLLSINSATDREANATLGRTDNVSQKLFQQAFAPTDLQAPTSRQSDNNDLQTNKVDQIVKLLQSLPGDFELNQTQLSFVLDQAGLAKDPQLATILGGVTKVIKHGDHIELQRDSVTHIPLNQDIVKGLSLIHI